VRGLTWLGLGFYGGGVTMEGGLAKGKTKNEQKTRQGFRV